MQSGGSGMQAASWGECWNDDVKKHVILRENYALFSTIFVLIWVPLEAIRVP